MSTPPPIVIVHTSALLDWAPKEGHHVQVSTLLRDVGQASFAAPPHLLSEATNALQQRTRRTDNLPISQPEADATLAMLIGVRIVAIDDPALYPHALTLARRFGLTRTYDALYVALADVLDATFWTSDQRLVNQLAGALPFVRFIGSYPLASRTGPTP